MKAQEPTERKKRKSTPHRKVTPNERMTIIQLWTSGQGKVLEIARAMRRHPSTVYSVLVSAGLWPGIDDYTKAGNAPARHPAKPLTERRQPEPETITLIRGPQRSLWQRIKDFFS